MTVERRYGLVAVTLADFPGCVASTIFTTNCNLRCPYCHNAELAAGEIPAAFLSLDEIFSHFQKRKNKIGGVCISGGEPLLDPNIFFLVDEFKKLGLKIKLDTNGTFPEKLQELLRSQKIDYIAMDFKTSLNKYKTLSPSDDENIAEKILKSVKIILDSKIDHEFRTTAMPTLVESEDIIDIVSHIAGAQKYVIAQFKNEKTLSPLAAEISPHSEEKLKEMLAIAKDSGLNATVRGANF